MNANGDIKPPGLIMLGAVTLRDPLRFLIPGPPRARLNILMYSLRLNWAPPFFGALVPSGVWR